jgi:probable HAF family extracellular repeat protein
MIFGRSRRGRVVMKVLVAGMLAACLAATWTSGASAVPASSVRTGLMTDLGTLGGTSSGGGGINDLGQVAGSSDTTGGASHAFRWTPPGGMQDLGTLGGANSDTAAINDLGQVTGQAQTDSGTYHAFRWTPSGRMRDLGTLSAPFEPGSSGVAINDLGQVTGNSFGPAPAPGAAPTHAFRWTPSGGMQDLGTLGGENSYADAINDLGQVTGDAETADGSFHGFRWTPSGGMQDLGTLGGPSSSGFAINDLGQVTGISYTADSAGEDIYHAFRWTASAACRISARCPAERSARPRRSTTSARSAGLVTRRRHSDSLTRSGGPPPAACRISARCPAERSATAGRSTTSARSADQLIRRTGPVTHSGGRHSGSRHRSMTSQTGVPTTSLRHPTLGSLALVNVKIRSSSGF